MSVSDTGPSSYIVARKKIFYFFVIQLNLFQRTAVIRFMAGIYHVFIADWLMRFPRDQFLFIRLEDFSEDVEGHMRNIFDFLELGKIILFNNTLVK